jgi:hypothetical protein
MGGLYDMSLCIRYIMLAGTGQKRKEMARYMLNRTVT